MHSSRLAVLVIIFFLTSLISVVTGSTSLITVPVMIAAGMEAHVAVATNMMALILMSVGGTLPFTKRGVVRRDTLPWGILLTVLGSMVGALLLVRIPARALQLTIALAMIAVAVFSMAKHEHGGAHKVSSASQAGGYCSIFALAVYGGFFSGGYVTVLTTVFVLFFGLTFVQAIATTKVLNVFSSLVATLVFARRGLVSYELGAILGLTMFVGALLGGQLALQVPEVWLRRVFILAVVGLAAKLLLASL